MFRAGTTFLSQLLDQDLRQPCAAALGGRRQRSAADTADVSLGSPRRRRQRGIEMLESLNPRMKIVHHEDAEGPTECITLLGQDFKSLTWEAMANVPVVQRVAAQGRLRVGVRVPPNRAAGAPERGPTRCVDVEESQPRDRARRVDPTYPDARLVLLHRDPTVLCASACSLISTLTGTFSDADHTAYIAEHWTRLLDESIDAGRGLPDGPSRPRDHRRAIRRPGE